MLQKLRMLVTTSEGRPNQGWGAAKAIPQQRWQGGSLLHTGLLAAGSTRQAGGTSVPAQGDGSRENRAHARLLAPKGRQRKSCTVTRLF